VTGTCLVQCEMWMMLIKPVGYGNVGSDSAAAKSIQLEYTHSH